MTEKYAGGRLNERRTQRALKRTKRAAIIESEAVALARKLVELHARPYDNDTCHADNLEFEQVAMKLAKYVLLGK